MGMPMLGVLLAMVMSVVLAIVECCSPSDSTGRSVAILPIVMILAAVVLTFITASG